MRVVVMQGRLTPGETFQVFPPEWEIEFAVAGEAGIQGIEWLYDETPDNPLDSDADIARIRELSLKHNVSVDSVNAHRLLQGGLDLDRLLERCAAAGIARVVLPFLDGLAVDESMLRPGVVVETDPGQAAGLPLNYDTGNWRGRGIRELGPAIQSVHLKDVDADGRNVPLGHGVVDFPAVFEALREIGYDGDLVLETPRPTGDPVAWGRQQAEFVRRLVPWTSWR